MPKELRIAVTLEIPDDIWAQADALSAAKPIVEAFTEVVEFGAAGWVEIQSFGRARGLLMPDDERALRIACSMPTNIPTDKQAERLRQILHRCRDAGFSRLAPAASAR